MDRAFTVLRRYAHDRGEKLSAVADRIVTCELRADDVTQYAHTVAILA